MKKEFENRWCKFCVNSTKQEIVFVPEMATYKRRRKFLCTVCKKSSWMQGKRPSAESVY
jgi:hypothetical protein